MWAPWPVRTFWGKKKFLVCVVNRNLSFLLLVTMPTELFLYTGSVLRRSAACDWVGENFAAQKAV